MHKLGKFCGCLIMLYAISAGAEEPIQPEYTVVEVSDSETFPAEHDAVEASAPALGNTTETPAPILNSAKEPLPQARGSTVDLRIAAFIPQAKRFRNVYGTVGPVYEIQATTQISSNFDFWANFDWFYQSSSGGDCNCRSTVNIPNFSSGISYCRSIIDELDLYLGIGPLIGGVLLKNRSCCGEEKSSAWAAGVVVKSGARWNFYSIAFLEVFVDYLYETAFFDKHINVGGTKAGGGIGVKF